MGGSGLALEPGAGLEELRNSGFYGENARDAMRPIDDRAWRARRRGFSEEEINRGRLSGEGDLNGPESKLFDVPKGRKKSQYAPPGPSARHAQSGARGGKGRGAERGGNPFNLKNPDLRRQAEIVEGDPELARLLIRQAKRRPELFNL